MKFKIIGDVLALYKRIETHQALTNVNERIENHQALASTNIQMAFADAVEIHQALANANKQIAFVKQMALVRL